MKILNKISFFIIVVHVFSCNNIRKDNNYQILNFRDAFNINVKRIKDKRLVLILNDTFIINKTNPLIYNDYNPKWLFKRTNQKKVEDKKALMTPKITDVEPPYKITKEKESNVFVLIKNTDTLRFYLILPDEMQLDL